MRLAATSREALAVARTTLQQAAYPHVELSCGRAQERTGVSLPTAPLYDIQIKRIHKHKRQSTT